ncbi:hypothetical protein COLO4_30563 [Corchorus olitorius]|uniref:Uncharacterized protein n=1 Tax=Corchorus olitorius TaxID=93759 RepID=A0A1R3H7X0_9ROSI|nr:hypothetical protein COLO4_30563 [Corchorus olitorius]
MAQPRFRKDLELEIGPCQIATPTRKIMKIPINDPCRPKIKDKNRIKVTTVPDIVVGGRERGYN